jgi:ketosteroid isomerase-like protein
MPQRPQNLRRNLVTLPRRPVLLWRAMATTQLPSLSEIKQRIAETNRLFNDEVFAHRNFDALDQIYTADARVLPPGAPMISGRAAIKKFWADMVLGAHAVAAELGSVDVMQAGDGVVEIGRAVLTVAPPGQAQAKMEVKYVVYWREEDGRWKWHVDIWNPNA